MEIRRAVLHGKCDLRIETAAIPDRLDVHQLLVETEITALSTGTDLGNYLGDSTYVPGAPDYPRWVGYSNAGYTKPSYGGKWDVYEGYSKVGYAKRSYGGNWDLYEGYSKVGSIKPGNGGKWQVYQGYSSVGSVKGGPGGPAAGAALLLLVG